MYDNGVDGPVLIVGLGLVGTFAAILFSQLGYQVRCIEKRSFSDALLGRSFSKVQRVEPYCLPFQKEHEYLLDWCLA